MSNSDIFVAIIENAKGYVKGELELDCVEDVWIAMDYREDLGCALPIEVDGFNNRLITVDEARKSGIDVRICCDYCGVAYVG